jgi:hypothetical protein
MSLRTLAFLLPLLLVGCSSGPTADPTADLVLRNGTIATLDEAHGDVSALAAAGDTILAVGGARMSIPTSEAARA